MKNELGGITVKYRLLLSNINRKARAPFTIKEFAEMLEIPLNKARRLVQHWVSMGWLTRIKRGLYSTVPLDALRPKERKEDPWIVATKVFSPCYIGGWSACEQWGLTDQLFNDIVVFSCQDVRRKKHIIQGLTYIVKRITKKKMFGTKIEWRDQVKCLVSDLERTIVDVLNEPILGGGIRHIALVINDYFLREEKKVENLVKYIKKSGNRTIYKRLGYLIEALNIKAPYVLRQCSQNVGAGYSKLDPNMLSKGKYLRRWNLLLNVDVKGLL